MLTTTCQVLQTTVPSFSLGRWRMASHTTRSSPAPDTPRFLILSCRETRSRCLRHTCRICLPIVDPRRCTRAPPSPSPRLLIQCRERSPGQISPTLEPPRAGPTRPEGFAFLRPRTTAAPLWCPVCPRASPSPNSEACSSATAPSSIWKSTRTVTTPAKGKARPGHGTRPSRKPSTRSVGSTGHIWRIARSRSARPRKRIPRPSRRT